MAQLSLEQPIVAVHEDRFIIRTYSPATTIAGGVVLNPFASRHRAKEFDKTTEQLQRMQGSDAKELVSAFVTASGLHGLRVGSVAAATGWKRDVLMRAIAQAENASTVVHTNGVLVSARSFEQLCQNVLREIENFHKREPLARGMLRETLREKVFAHSFPELFAAVLDKLVAERHLVSEKDTVRATSHNVDLSEADSKLRRNLEEIYLKAGAEAPSLDEALVRAGVVATARVQARKVLQLLIDDGSIVRINNEMFLHHAVAKDLKTRLHSYASQHEPERLIDVAAFKDLAGVSRKYAIPLLEYFDRERVTRRAGDKRLILPKL